MDTTRDEYTRGMDIRGHVSRGRRQLAGKTVAGKTVAGKTVASKTVVSKTVARALVIVAGGFGLAACSFAMPSLDFFSSKPTTASLSIESTPPGADAKLSTGPTCKTPCSLSVSLASEFTVTVSLTGYGPETRTVKPVTPESGTSSSGANALLDPNPLFVELKSTTPPKPAKKVVKHKRPIQSASPAAAPAAQDAQAPAPGGFGPAPGGFTPTPGRIQ
jgi:PEGA domain